MKPTLIAFFISVALHGILFLFHFDFLRPGKPGKLKINTITVNLSYRQPHRNFLPPLNLQTDFEAIKPLPLLKEKLPKKQPTGKKATITQKRKLPPKIKPKVKPPDKNPLEKVSSDHLAPMKDADRPAPADALSSISGSRSNQASTSIRQFARPLYKRNPPIKYPAYAKKRGYEGTVLLDVLVDASGTVEKIKLFKSSGHSILDKKAMSSVNQWLFEPAMKDNKKIRAWVRIPVEFSLK
jgi:protein TonB